MCGSLLVRCYKAPAINGKVLSLNETSIDDRRSKGLIIDPPDY